MTNSHTQKPSYDLLNSLPNQLQFDFTSFENEHNPQV